VTLFPKIAPKTYNSVKAVSLKKVITTGGLVLLKPPMG
jgi:hypothetical protein